MISEDITEEKADENQVELNYSFSEVELDTLAILFRKNIDNLPKELDAFSRFVEYYIYNKMTIIEAEDFFNSH